MPSIDEIEPGDPTNSLLYQKITSSPFGPDSGPSSPMPPHWTGDVLADVQKDAVLQWILCGAPR